MTALRGVLTLFLAAGLLAACGDDDPIDPDPDPEEFEWTAVLEGTDGWEHLSGEAGVLWVEDETESTASASIEGDEPAAVRPWHVHVGTCAGGGGIVGTDGDYPRLTVGGDGSATTSVTVPMGLDVAASYHVNVHLSEAELGTIIACGDLNLLESN